MSAQVLFRGAVTGALFLSQRDSQNSLTPFLRRGYLIKTLASSLSVDHAIANNNLVDIRDTSQYAAVDSIIMVTALNLGKDTKLLPVLDAAIAGAIIALLWDILSSSDFTRASYNKEPNLKFSASSDSCSNESFSSSDEYWEEDPIVLDFLEKYSRQKHNIKKEKISEKNIFI